MATKFDFESKIAKGVPPNSPPGDGLVPKYNFGVGFVDPDSFPSAGLHEALGRALKDYGRDLALYPTYQGSLQFREMISDYLKRRRGMDVDPGHIVLTPGSTQAIMVLARLFTDPGDVVLTDEYAHSDTISMLRRFTSEVVGVTMDHEGIIPDALDQTMRDLAAKGKQAKFLLTVPTFNNPVGTDMGLQRRQDILAVAQKHGVPIYEDDCYVDLRYDGETSPAIYSYDDSNIMVYSGTFSKTVGPGMRLGWLVAPEELIPRINALNHGANTSQFTVLAGLYYLRDHLDEHIDELCNIFRSRRDTMLAAVGESMGSAAVSTHPGGGLYLWVSYPEGVDTGRILAKARQRGVSYGPGVAYSPNGVAQNYMRLCYGYYNDDETREGIAILADVLAEEGALG